MKFSDIIGQQEIKEQLINMVRNERLSHALMLHGIEGIGKKALAFAFAQYIVCENKTEHDACGVCKACRQAQKMTHPDIHYVFPVTKEGSKSAYSDLHIDAWRSKSLENPYFTYQDWNQTIGDGSKLSSIYVDESNEIIKKLNFKAFESDYKVMLIWLPEKMNQQTANKLLKTLEEPYPKTVLLLISEKPQELLSTIISRVQQIKVAPIKKEALKQFLQSEYSIDDTLAEYAVKYAKGSVPKAIEAIQQSESNERYHEWFVQFMRLSFTNKMLDLIALNDEIVGSRKSDIQGFLEYSIRYLRDNYMINQNMEDLVALIGEEANFSSKFSNFISDVNIERMYQAINNCMNQLKRNANAKIQFQVLAIEMVRAFSLVNR